MSSRVVSTVTPVRQTHRRTQRHSRRGPTQTNTCATRVRIIAEIANFHVRTPMQSLFAGSAPQMNNARSKTDYARGSRGRNRVPNNYNTQKICTYMCNSLQQFSFHKNPRFSTLLEIPPGISWKIAENRTLKEGSSPPRAFKLFLLKNLCFGWECRFQPHFFAVDDTRAAIQSLLHAAVGSSARQGCPPLLPSPTLPAVQRKLL